MSFCPKYAWSGCDVSHGEPRESSPVRLGSTRLDGVEQFRAHRGHATEELRWVCQRVRRAVRRVSRTPRRPLHDVSVSPDIDAHAPMAGQVLQLPLEGVHDIGSRVEHHQRGLTRGYELGSGGAGDSVAAIPGV
jgi:hypothetical protein